MEQLEASHFARWCSAGPSYRPGYESRTLSAITAPPPIEKSWLPRQPSPGTSVGIWRPREGNPMGLFQNDQRAGVCPCPLSGFSFTPSGEEAKLTFEPDPAPTSYVDANPEPASRSGVSADSATVLPLDSPDMTGRVTTRVKASKRRRRHLSVMRGKF